MQCRIKWTIFLEVNREEKCKRLIKAISQALGADLAETQMERYWKDKKLFRVTAHLDFEASSANDAVGQVLRLANCLAFRWEIGGPQFYEHSCELLGWNQPGTCRMSGIHAIGFEASALLDRDTLFPSVAPGAGAAVSPTAAAHER